MQKEFNAVLHERLSWSSKTGIILLYPWTIIKDKKDFVLEARLFEKLMVQTGGLTWKVKPSLLREVLF